MGTFEPLTWQTQDGFSYRFDWGPHGALALAACAVVIVVDVLTFSTAVTMAAERGHAVPVLVDEPEPGAQVTLAAASTGATVVAGSFRNATAVAEAAHRLASGGPIGIVAAGERWPDDTLRPAEEDLLGAGAILHALDPSGSLTEPCCSPAARAARAAFLDAEPLLLDLLTATASGRQLWERGQGTEVREAARHNISQVVPTLHESTFT